MAGTMAVAEMTTAGAGVDRVVRVMEGTVLVLVDGTMDLGLRGPGPSLVLAGGSISPDGFALGYEGPGMVSLSSNLL